MVLVAFARGIIRLRPWSCRRKIEVKASTPSRSRRICVARTYPHVADLKPWPWRATIITQPSTPFVLKATSFSFLRLLPLCRRYFLLFPRLPCCLPLSSSSFATPPPRTHFTSVDIRIHQRFTQQYPASAQPALSLHPLSLS